VLTQTTTTLYKCVDTGQCKKKVDSQSAADHEGELYCKSCYGRQFGPRGYGFAGGAGTMMAGDATDALRRRFVPIPSRVIWIYSQKKIVSNLGT